MASFKKSQMMARLCRNNFKYLIVLASFVFLVLYLSGVFTEEVVIQDGRAAVTENDNEVDQDDSSNLLKKISTSEILRRLPDCIIIGCRKGGTNALISFLKHHPSIETATQEIHFFDSEANYAKGLSWYQQSMPLSSADQITMEKTPAYFHTSFVPGRVQIMDPNIKLIVIFREPVDRAISDYLEVDNMHRSRKSFDELAYDFLTNKVRTNFGPVERSVYSKHLKNWLQYFKMEQFIFINGDKIVTDPVPELRRVENFLNIEHYFTQDMFSMNATKGFYCWRQDDEEKCLPKSKGRPHPIVQPRVTTALKRYFAPSIKELYRLVKQDYGWLDRR